jgi:hypothetical protein
MNRLVVTVGTTWFHIKKSYAAPTRCIYVFFLDFTINSDYFPMLSYLIGFCNRDGECLLRGTG